MRAILIAVGSELLDRDKIDTNSIYLTQKLMDWGILTDMKVVVGDDIDQLGWIVKNAKKRAQLVVITGGLGPTEDDITREAVASALKRELEFREDILDKIKLKFKKRGIEMSQNNMRQAFILKGAEILSNDVGTAPGLYINEEPCKLVLLPGPPHEMIPIFNKVLEEKIAPLSNFFIYKRSLKFGGLTESGADSKIAEIYAPYKNPKTTILATPGVIEVHLLGRSKKTVEEAQLVTDQVAEKIKQKLGEYYITDRDISFEQFIVEELRFRNLTISLAESCTGGGLGNRITNVPGSSEVFLGGIVAYSNESKIKLLGVKETTINRHGAVSKETAAEMARGIRKLTGSDIGVSITGIAGPSGASPNKPVGLVFIHLSSQKKDVGLYQIFPGERKIVKIRTINYSLDLIRRYLQELSSMEYT